MQIVFLLEQVVNGLVLGGYYLLLALGLSLIFSVGGVVNLAHGAFYALGAYASLEVGRRLGFGAAVVLSPVLVGLLGIAFEREPRFGGILLVCGNIAGLVQDYRHGKDSVFGYPCCVL